MNERTRRVCGTWMVRCAMALAAAVGCGGEEGAAGDVDAAADAVADAAEDAAPEVDAALDVASDRGAPDGAGDAAIGVEVKFSQVRAEQLTESSAVIRFETSAPVLGSVEYGPGSASLDSVAVDPEADPLLGQTSHSVALGGLSADTVWTFRARGVDAEGVLHVSEPLQFTTLAPVVVPVTGNVALATHGAKIFAVSSNFGGLPNTSSKGANKVHDGDLDTQWASNGDGDGAFVELDLGADRAVARVGLRAAVQPSDGSGHIQTARVLFDGVDPGLGVVSLDDPDELYSFSLPAAVTVRRVRVEAVVTTGGNTGLREVQVFTPE